MFTTSSTVIAIARRPPDNSFKHEAASRLGMIQALGLIIKKILLAAACSVGTFALANGASYFLRSDGSGLHVVADGIRRCGFPLLFWEKGGFVAHEYFYPTQLAADVLFGVIVGVLLSKLLRRLLAPA